jgi:hypothetical protein
MNIVAATYPRVYVRPMEKHELELVTSTCTMSCNVLLHDCTRHIGSAKLEGKLRRNDTVGLLSRRLSHRARRDGNCYGVILSPDVAVRHVRT